MAQQRNDDGEHKADGKCGARIFENLAHFSPYT
jgi:hypothetical protein